MDMRERTKFREKIGNNIIWIKGVPVIDRTGNKR